MSERCPKCEGHCHRVPAFYQLGRRIAAKAQWLCRRCGFEFHSQRRRESEPHTPRDAEDD